MTAPLLPARTPASERRRFVALGAAVGIGALLFAFPFPAMRPEAARLLAVLAAAIVLWVTEALPVGVTALAAPALCVVLGVAPADKAFASFGNPLLYLFFGAFVLAAAAERTRLDRWLAGRLLPGHGATPLRKVLTLTYLTAGLSSMLSNTATTAMVLPVLRATVARLSDRARALGLLTAAYASSLGGVLTPVGTPPNLLAIAALRQYAKGDVPFFAWTLVALPMVAVLLGLWTLLLVRGLRGATQATDDADLGPQPGTLPQGSVPLDVGQRSTLIALGVAVVGWVLPGLLELVLGSGAETVRAVKRALPEGVVGIAGAALLFVLPATTRSVAGSPRPRPVLEWGEATQIDWGTILLFGGGLALGDLAFQTGLSAWIGQGVLEVTGVRSEIGLTVLFSTVAVLLSEVTSNTAAAAMLCPLAVMTSQQVGISPVAPCIAAGMAASMGFLMPISTAPNAIVYGTGQVPLRTMAKTGAVLDLAGILVIPPVVLVVTHWIGLR